MTPDDAPPTTRRARRAQTAPAPIAPDAADSAATSVAVLDSQPASDAPDLTSPAVESPSTVSTGTIAARPGRRTKPVPAPRVALGWVVESSVTAPPALLAGGSTLTGSSTSAPTTSATAIGPDLLARRPRRSPFRPSVIMPVLVVLAVFGLYSGTTLLWPLYAVTPEITASTIEPIAAPAAAPAWPAAGSAAIGVKGIDGTPATTADRSSIASITKLVTSLMILDELPLALGEQGPEYRFTAADQRTYQAYRNRGESALAYPVGGSLTEYQMLQGILISSANNYADRLASTIWPTDAVFANAAASWLASHGLTGITIVDPSGIADENNAEPTALIALAAKALANPVIAEIVKTPSAELPGAGLIENSNPLIADAGVVGVKTGTLSQFYNLLVAKDILIGDTTVRLYASVLGQSDDDARAAAARALFAQMEAELQLRPSVTAGTVAGVVTTEWGDRVDVLTSSDAAVVLWNGGSGEVTVSLALGDDVRTAESTVGTLTVTGPLNSASVDVHLAGDISEPSPWWRLTHPLELFGLAG